VSQCVVISADSNKMVVVGVEDNKEQLICFISEFKAISDKPAVDIATLFSEINCIESDSKTEFIFVGGSSTNGKGIISVLRFSRELNTIASSVFSEPEMNKISKLRKLGTGIDNPNIILAASQTCISIIQFKPETGTLIELRQLRNMHTMEISDFVFEAGTFFTVSKYSNYIHKY